MTVVDVWKQKPVGTGAGAASPSAGADGDAEAILVQRCLAGDRPAFDALVLAYRSRVYALARLALGSTEDADDVAQETFVRAYAALPRYRPRGLFRVWLYTIAANLFRHSLTARPPIVSWAQPGVAA